MWELLKDFLLFPELEFKVFSAPEPLSRLFPGGLVTEFLPGITGQWGWRDICVSAGKPSTLVRVRHPMSNVFLQVSDHQLSMVTDKKSLR